MPRKFLTWVLFAVSGAAALAALALAINLFGRSLHLWGYRDSPGYVYALWGGIFLAAAVALALIATSAIRTARTGRRSPLLH